MTWKIINDYGLIASPIAHRLNNVWNSENHYELGLLHRTTQTTRTLNAYCIGLHAVSVCVQKVLADDYFNPALLDIDNPGQGKTDLSIYMRLVPVRLPVNITLMSTSTIIKWQVKRLSSR